MKKKESEKRKLIKWKDVFLKRKFTRLLVIILIFAVAGAVVTAERRNVKYVKGTGKEIPILEMEEFEPRRQPSDSCLYLWNSNEVASENAKDEFTAILDEMRLGYELMDISQIKPDDFESYQKVVIGIVNLSSLGAEHILQLMDWVEAGGSLLSILPFELDGTLRAIGARMGIVDMGNSYVLVEKIRFCSEFMIGAERGDEYPITDPFNSSMPVILDSSCNVYLDNGGEVPLLWEYRYGDGKVVVNNLGFIERVYRGFYAASYSLLGDICAYPVINGSAFYLDDFPSPAPLGYSEYVKRDYNMTIEDFYYNIWWPDIQKLSEEFGIRFTGLTIETYSDQTEGELEKNQDTQKLIFYGNTLLAYSGEIGFHGYNHMPLCLESFDYKNAFDYNKWKSVEKLEESISELSRFCKELFPREKFQVYVPPSNILSDEGRRVLVERFPEIKAIASVYFTGKFEYSQEFSVSEDGMIEIPRITAGCYIDDYMKIAALSELNMHFVSSHFHHPDDALDEGRGAADGWEKLYSSLHQHMSWLYKSAPAIRNVTGSEMAAAVERFYYAGVEIQENEDEIRLSIHNFKDEVWLFLRVNEGELGTVNGGTAEKVADHLYLIHAQEPEVIISRQNAG